MGCQVQTIRGMAMVLCSRARRPRRCSACKKRDATRLCDFPGDLSGTCSKPLCTTCAVMVGAETDYCPSHRCRPIALTYGAGVEDAEARMRRGERQRLCRCCGRWRWPDEKPMLIEKETR